MTTRTRTARALLACLVVLLSVPAPAATLPVPQTVTYERYLKMRAAPGTVVLNAFNLEPLFHVVPPGMESQGLTQAELDTILAALIPTKDTPVILFCEEVFSLTRRASAETSVGIMLMRNGYTHVYQMETLWQRKKWDERTIAEIREQDFEPYDKTPDIAPQEGESYWDAILRAYRDAYLSQEGKGP